jgi:hypothetical protein
MTTPTRVICDALDRLRIVLNTSVAPSSSLRRSCTVLADIGAVGLICLFRASMMISV